MSGAYYNEIDPYAARWLRNLIASGHIAPGDVDERDIRLVQPAELASYTQCHFFAGIGIWSRALRLAGWPDDRPAWSGSCPCQPFSTAGARGGHEDERHLWPTWFGLIRESRPVACFGEQVADGDGEAWFDDVGSDLEGIGYTVGAVSAAACGFGAPHERQRLFFVADTDGRHASAEGLQRGWEHGQQPQDGGTPPGLADATARGRGAGRRRSALEGRSKHGRTPLESSGRGNGDVGDPIGSRLEVGSRAKVGRRAIRGERTPPAPPGVVGGFWADARLVYCADERWRPIGPGVFPLAHGATARVGRLRAYGNAIVAPVAAEFIRAYIDARHLS